jgi:hypothetical protein
MLFESSQTNKQIQRYIESCLLVASRILYQFTTDKINKDGIFFDLLDIENILFAHTKSLLLAMLKFTWKENRQL